MDLKQTHINYIQNTLIANILADKRFFGHELKSCSVSTGAAKLDGFMSAIYQVDLSLFNEKDKR